MKLKNKIILIIIIAFILFVPIGVYAKTTQLKTVFFPDDDIEYTTYDEKPEYSEPIMTTITSDNMISIETNEEKEQIENEVLETENTIIKVMNEYYPNEFTQIQNELNNRTYQNINAPLTINSPEIKLCNLLIDVLENNFIENDKREILKNFLDSQYENLSDCPDIQNKIINFLNK